MFLLSPLCYIPSIGGAWGGQCSVWKTYTMQTLISFWKSTALVVDVFVQFSNTLLNVFV